MGCCCNMCIFPAPLNYYEPFPVTQQNQILSFTQNTSIQVPYVKIQPQQNTNHNQCVIFFHGNAEDLSNASNFLLPFARATQTTFYAIQYPSYGRYNKLKYCLIAQRIKQDAINFHSYLSKSYEDIIIMGRSIGSGPAVHLASHVKQCKKLILISPFCTIPEVAQKYVGCLSCLLSNSFDNITNITQYNGQLLVIHGCMDQVIPHHHGVKLVDRFYGHNKSVHFIEPPKMTHNKFNLHQDLVINVAKFLKPQ